MAIRGLAFDVTTHILDNDTLSQRVDGAQCAKEIGWIDPRSRMNLPCML